MNDVTAGSKGATDIEALLGKDKDLLTYVCKAIPKASLHLPGNDWVDRCVAPSDRSPAVLCNLQRMFDHGRLAGTGYLSILPVDQGIEHSRRRIVREKPDYVRSGKHRQAGDRRRLQCSRFDARRARRRARANTRTRFRSCQDQSQRISHLPEQVRPDHVREH